MKKILILTLVSMALLTSACATKSDKLGLGKDGDFGTYAESFQPARDMLNNGQFDALAAHLNQNATDKEGNKLANEENQDKLINEYSELSLLERGLLTLNTGNFKRALHYFDAAEIKMEKEESAMAKAGSTAGKGAFIALTGSEEFSDYALRGYEKVMLYNYKALCYMLLGDRRAYNVTRRAIDKQQEEWELFRTMIEKAKAEAKDSSDDSSAEDNRDQYTIKKAGSVASAYVNPFADYMNGMIMEIDSIKDATLRDNARIAYSKALENNKECVMAKQAVAQLRDKKAPKGQKMVQILLSDGFSPERKVQSKMYQHGKVQAMVNFTLATPHLSQVTGAKVGKVTLSPLSDVEALILRDDQDRAPLRTLMYAAALLRSGAVSAFGGNEIMALTSKAQKPDTRSWLSLPSKVLVARMYVPNNTKQIELKAHNASGQALSNTTVKLADSGPTVVYAVSYGSQLHAYANESSWIK